MRINILNNKSTILLLAILGGIIIFFLSPEVLNNIGDFNLLLIIAPIVILSFYYLARKYENYYLLFSASLILFSSVFANIQIGMTFVFVFPIIYLTDEFNNNSWKDGLSVLIVLLGIYLLSALWVQNYIPEYDNTSLFALCFNMGGVVLILFWVAWIQRGLPPARKALAFCLPAIFLLLIWVTYKGTGKEIFSVIQSENDIIIKNFIFKNIFFQSIWLCPLVVLKIFLLILGCIQLYNKQFGILALFLILIISIHSELFLKKNSQQS